MSSSYPSVIPCSRLYSNGRREITLLNYSEGLSIIICALQPPHTRWYSQLSHCDHTLALAFLLAPCSNSNLHLCTLNLFHILSSSKSSPRNIVHSNWNKRACSYITVWLDIHQVEARQKYSRWSFNIIINTPVKYDATGFVGFASPVAMSLN